VALSIASRKKISLELLSSVTKSTSVTKLVVKCFSDSCCRFIPQK
jgi:hypothetical protein